MEPRSNRSLRRRYPILRSASIVFLAVGVLGIIAGGVLIGQAFRSGSDAITAAYTLAAGLMCVAYSEVVRLMIDVEENTRSTAELLSHVVANLSGNRNGSDSQKELIQMLSRVAERLDAAGERSRAEDEAAQPKQRPAWDHSDSAPSAPRPRWRVSGSGEKGKTVVKEILADTREEALAVAVLDGMKVHKIERVGG